MTQVLNNNNNHFIIKVSIYLAGQRPTNWGHHLYLTTLRWTETFHTTDTRTNTHVSEDLRFNVLIREDVKV